MSYDRDKMRDSRDDSPTYKPPEAAKMSAGTYIATRIPTLKPPMNKAPNPFKLLAMLNFQQWMFFLVGFLAWSWDAFDFFTVSLTVEQLAKQFGKQNSQITWGITLVLMFRSVGSVLFGEHTCGAWGRNQLMVSQASPPTDMAANGPSSSTTSSL